MGTGPKRYGERDNGIYKLKSLALKRSDGGPTIGRDAGREVLKAAWNAARQPFAERIEELTISLREVEATGDEWQAYAARQAGGRLSQIKYILARPLSKRRGEALVDLAIALGGFMEMIDVAPLGELVKTTLKENQRKSEEAKKRASLTDDQLSKVFSFMAKRMRKDRSITQLGAGTDASALLSKGKFPGLKGLRLKKIPTGKTFSNRYGERLTKATR